jgi:hypothetical protein
VPEGEALGEADGKVPTVAVAEVVDDTVGEAVGEGSAQVMARSRLLDESENTRRLREKSNTRPMGPFIAVDVQAAVPVPIMVTTAPVTVLTRRMRWPVKSETASCRPDAAAAMPTGSLKVAAAPTPSVPPGAPLPAKVPTAPDVVFTKRTLLQKRSTRYSRCPSTPRASENAWLNVALAPAPSLQPAVPLPAKRLTVGEPTRLLTTRINSLDVTGRVEVET